MELMPQFWMLHLSWCPGIQKTRGRQHENTSGKYEHLTFVIKCSIWVNVLRYVPPLDTGFTVKVKMEQSSLLMKFSLSESTKSRLSISFNSCWLNRLFVSVRTSSLQQGGFCKSTEAGRPGGGETLSGRRRYDPLTQPWLGYDGAILLYANYCHE